MSPRWFAGFKIGRRSGKAGHMNVAKPKVVAMKGKAARAPRAKRKRGAAKMREAADKIVGRDCKPIIEALSSNGQKGQTLSAKFLYGLAQSAEESAEADGANKFRKVALAWANSPEWGGNSNAEEPGEETDEN
jgi:hypothetical protein